MEDDGIAWSLGLNAGDGAGVGVVIVGGLVGLVAVAVALSKSN
jgi:hypothetical protein